MDFKNFSSESTYCSLYENQIPPEKRKCKTTKLSGLKFLDKVHKEVIHHFEGKKLIGRVEVVQYMKQISKMKLKNPRNQYFAEKIQSSLLKIYNLLKQFEKSLSIGNLSPTLESIENYSFTDDFQINVNNNEDHKQILLRTTTVNDDKSSFPLEMLTNDNFISSSYQSINSPSIGPSTENEEIFVGEVQLGETESMGIESNNSEFFLSENSEIHLKNCPSLSSVEVVSTQPFSNIRPDTLNSNKIDDSTKGSNLMSNERKQVYCTNIISTCGKLECSNQDGGTDRNTITESFADTRNSEQCKTIIEISKMCANLSIKHKSNAITSDTNVNFNNEDLPASTTNLNLKSVTDLGNLFNECYHTNIYNLCYGTGKNLNKNKSWQEIEYDFTNGEYLTIHDTLEELIKKFQIEESCIHETQNIHDFNEEDNKKLDVIDLMNTNKKRLEQISEELQMYINSRQNASEEELDDFEVLNWKILLH